MAAERTRVPNMVDTFMYGNKRKYSKNIISIKIIIF